jgi:glycosyltransferase involved in cell wall biosynthesis
MLYSGCIPFFPFYSSDRLSDRGYIEYGYLNITLVGVSNSSAKVFGTRVGSPSSCCAWQAVIRALFPSAKPSGDKTITSFSLSRIVRVLSLLANVSGATYKTMNAVLKKDPETEFSVVLRNQASDTGKTLGYNPESLDYLGRFSHSLSMYLLGSASYHSKRLRGLIDRTGAEVVHTFGAPDDLGFVAKKNCELPVVHEVFDSTSLYDPESYGMPKENSLLNLLGIYRLTRPLLIKRELGWEDFVHRNCDALVYTSEYMLKEMRERYGDFSSVVIPNAVLKEDVPQERLAKLSDSGSGINAVYVGQIELKAGHRRILPALQEIAERGINVHLYATFSNPKVREVVSGTCLKNPRMFWHDPLPYRRLLKELTQYDFGLVLLSQANERLLNVAIPNKIYEYLTAGLPVIVSPYRSLVDFVRRERCGYVLRSLDEIEDVFGKRFEVDFREEYTIDFHIDKLIQLYEDLT